MAESFNAALKNERVYRTVYPTKNHAIQDVVRYIEFATIPAESIQDSQQPNIGPSYTLKDAVGGV